MSRLRFVADSMLGTLAKRLRMLGIDTLYLRDAEDGELRYIVRAEDRTLLTKNRELFRALPEYSWLVNGSDVRGEFLSICCKLEAVSSQLEPLSLCLHCNDLLEPVEKDRLPGKVPPYVLKRKKKFMGCLDCGKVYWEGTHGSKMKDEINWMKRQIEAGS